MPNQQFDIRFSCVCPVTGHEFRHNPEKNVGSPDYFHNVMQKFVVNKRTDDEKRTSQFVLCKKYSINYPINVSCVYLLTMQISPRAGDNFCGHCKIIDEKGLAFLVA